MKKRNKRLIFHRDKDIKIHNGYQSRLLGGVAIQIYQQTNYSFAHHRCATLFTSIIFFSI